MKLLFQNLLIQKGHFLFQSVFLKKILYISLPWLDLRVHMVLDEDALVLRFIAKTTDAILRPIPNSLPCVVRTDRGLCVGFFCACKFGALLR